MIIDLLLVLIIGGVTWCVASEGAWGAGVVFLCVIFSGLVAMNCFEPLAEMLGRSNSSIEPYADVASLISIFTISTFVLRLLTEQIAVDFIDMDGRLYQLFRFGFAGLTGYVTAAILLTALHTCPLPRDFLGFKPERANLFEFAAPDRQWLGYTQYVTEHIFSGNRPFDGASYKLPGDNNAAIMPSFPIRYANRRANYDRTGQLAASGSGVKLNTNKPGTQQPAGGF